MMLWFSLQSIISWFPVHSIFQVELEEGELEDDADSREEAEDDQDSDEELGGSLPGNFFSILFMNDRGNIPDDIIA